MIKNALSCISYYHCCVWCATCWFGCKFQPTVPQHVLFQWFSVRFGSHFIAQILAEICRRSLCYCSLSLNFTMSMAPLAIPKLKQNKPKTWNLRFSEFHLYLGFLTPQRNDRCKRSHSNDKIVTKQRKSIYSVITWGEFPINFPFCYGP